MEKESNQILQELDQTLEKKAKKASLSFWGLFFMLPWIFRLPYWVNATQEEKQSLLIKYVVGKLIWLLILLIILVVILQFV